MWDTCALEAQLRGDHARAGISQGGRRFNPLTSKRTAHQLLSGFAPPRHRQHQLDLKRRTVGTDTARVGVRLIDYFAEPLDEILSDLRETVFVFVRTPGGWQLLKAILVRYAGGGSVRGD